jgi:dienelactone hydrolase
VPEPVPVETRAAAARERDRVRRAVAEMLGPIPPLKGAPPVVLEPIDVDGLAVERVILEARTDVPLPALAFRPGQQGSATPAVMVLDDRGKGAESARDGLAPALARAGVLAVVADLRGWGETAWVDDLWGWHRERRELMSADNMLSCVGYMLGCSSVAQRVHDALGVLAYVRSRPEIDPARVALLGIGGGAIVALHAAVLDGRVRAVAVCDGLATYRSIVDAPRYVHPVADFVPGALLHYDLPDLAAALYGQAPVPAPQAPVPAPQAPAHVLILNPQDALGAPLTPEAAMSTYGRAQQTVALLGGTLAVETQLTMEARWETIVQWATSQLGPVEQPERVE